MASIKDLANQAKQSRLRSVINSISSGVRSASRQSGITDVLSGSAQALNNDLRSIGNRSVGMITQNPQRIQLANEQRAKAQQGANRAFGSGIDPYTNKFSFTGSGAPKVALTATGTLMPGARVATAIGGAIGGGYAAYQGQDIGEGVGSGLSRGLQSNAVAGLTNPIISKIIPKGAGVVANRLLPAAANVGQGMLIDRATGQETTAGSVGIDAVVGAFGGRQQFDAPKAKLKPKQKTDLIPTENGLMRPAQSRLLKIESVQGRRKNGNFDFKVKVPEYVGNTKKLKEVILRVDPKNPQRLIRVGGKLDNASGFMAGIQPQYDEKGNLTGVTYNPELGALGFVGSVAGKKILTQLKGVTPEQRLQSKLTGQVGVPEQSMPSRVATSPADPNARTQSQLNNPVETRTNPASGNYIPPQPTKGVETFEALQADARKYKSADEWMSVKMKDDTTGALSNPDIRVMLTNEWNRLVGNGSRNQKINKIPEQSIISRQKLELIPGDKNSAKIDLIHTKNGWTPRIPDTDINPTGMIYPTKYSAETSIRNDYKSGKLVYNTSKAPTGDYPSVMAGNHVKQVSESGAFLLGTKPQPTKGLEAQDFEFNVGSGKQKVRIIDTPEGRRIQDLGTESIPMTSKQYLESQILRQEPRQTKTTVSPLTISNGSSSRLRTSQSIEQERLSSLQQELGGNLESLSDIRSQVDKEFLSKAVKSNTKSLKLSSSKGIVTPEIDREIAQVERAVDKKVNLLDYFRTPDRVLKKIGLEKESKLLKQKYDSYLEQLPKEIDKVNVWYEQVKNIPGSEQRIFRYLDGQQQTLEGVELKVAKEIQSYLRDWADKLDLPNDKRIASYITHIFEKDFVQKEFDPDLAKIISEKIPGSVYDPFLQQRLGKQGYVEDVFRALDAYVKRATRKYNMDQALEKIENAGEKLDLESWKYVKEYAERINLRPTDTDNLLDNMIKQSPIGYKLGQRPVANLTRAMRQSVYRATLGLNVGSALRNLTQGANTYAELGEKYTGIGYMQMLKNFNSGELETVGVMRNDFIQDRNISAKKAAWERLDKGLFSLFELAEKINRGSAYYGGKARALAKGATEQEAIEAGKAVAEKTQFKFGSIDTPVRLQGDLIKLLTQFQSYNVKQAEFLGEKIAQKDIAGLLRYIGAWSVFIYGAGNVLNLNPFSAIPWGSDIKEGESKIGQTPPIQLIKGLAKTALKSPDSYGSPASENLFERLSQNKVPDSIGASFVPAFSQAKKTIQGIQAYNRGYSQSSGGRARFPIEQNPGNRVKTTIFGQYSTQEARDYFNKDRSVLSETQTEVLSQLPNSQRKEYYNAVITKREADKAENEQLKAIESGNTKLATSTSEKIIKAKLEAGVPVSEQELSTVYLSQALKMPKSNRYETSQRNSALWNKSGSLYDNEDLTAEQKEILQNRIASELGVSRQDLDIYQVTKQDNDSKTLYAYDKLDQSQSFDDFMRYLVNGRKPINGKILVSDGVINNLVEDGLIPEALGDDIKDIDLKEDGTLKTGTKSRKKSAAARAKATNDYFEDLKKIKVGTSFTRGGTQAQRINTKNLTFSGA